MIPYFQFVSFSIGPFTFYAWGLFVALGVVVGTWVTARLSKRFLVDSAHIWNLSSLVTLAGLLGARLFHVVVYQPAYYMTHLSETVQVWDGGFSVIGGLIGALCVFLWYLRKHQLDKRLYADACLFGFSIGYAIGRLGCFVIHDHPGISTQFFLGVVYPDGVIRHDLGLYESMHGLLLVGLFTLTFQLKERYPQNKFVPPLHVVFLTVYGCVRFLLDFLRVSDGMSADVRYVFLTPAQYVSVLFFLVGFVLYIIHFKRYTTTYHFEKNGT